MAEELPIACSLQGPALADRLDRWRLLADRHLIEASKSPDGGAVQRYRAGDDALAELRELIRLERDCCPFLDFALAERGAEIVLEVRAPEAAAGVIAAFAGEGV